MGAATAILLAAAAWPGPADPGDPFRTAALSPPDVGVFVHVTAAAEARAELADRPIARWARSLLSGGQVPVAWQRLANAAGVEAGQLFDTCLGLEVTVVVRDHQEGAAEWAVLTETDPQVSAAQLGRLAPRVLGPKHNLAVLDLPDHDLLVARSGRMLLIGPRLRSGLFYEMVPNLTAPPQRALADNPALAEARRLGPGRVGLFVRHQPPLGGWSVAVANLRGRQIEIRHAAEFDNPPFGRAVPETEWSLAPIRSLEEKTILAVIEATGTGGGPLDAFITAGLGEAAMTAQMRQNLSVRQITTIADFDGRLGKPAFDLLFPTAARIYEVRDADLARRQLDDQMWRLLTKLARMGEGHYELPLPDRGAWEAAQPRSVPIGPAAKWLLGVVPGAEQVSLNWTVTSSAESHWSIVATSPQHLEAVEAALCGAPAAGPAPGTEAAVGRWYQCGTADGPRLARQLRSWRDQAVRLAAPQDVDAFRDTVGLLGDLADGVQRCRWQLVRPSARRMRLDAQIILSAPESAR